MKHCIILSGGMESTTMLFKVANEIISEHHNVKLEEYLFPICFDYGQVNKKEIEMAKKSCEFLGINLKIVKLSHFKELIGNNTSALLEGSTIKPLTAEENAGNPQVNTYVPYRNAQFIFSSACYAESMNCDKLYLGVNISDTFGYWDTSVEFIESIKNVLKLNRKNPIELETPFIELYKHEILKLSMGYNEYFDTDILKYTWSCYARSGENNEKECGLCTTCTEKLTGYIKAEFPDEVILEKFDITSEDLKKLKSEF